MGKKETNHLSHTKRILDNPEVDVIYDDVERAIRKLKVRVGRLGTFTLLKRRKENASVTERRKAKRKKAKKRIKEKQKKEAMK